MSFAISNYWHRVMFTRIYKLLSPNNHTENKWLVRIWCFQSTGPRIHISPEGGEKSLISLGPSKKWEQFENVLQALRAQSILISSLTKQPTNQPTTSLPDLSWGVTDFLASIPEHYKWLLFPVKVAKVNGSWGAPVKTVDLAQRCTWDMIFQMVSVGGLGWDQI